MSEVKRYDISIASAERRLRAISIFRFFSVIRYCNRFYTMTLMAKKNPHKAG
jgi:hypothetical protein